MKILIVGASKGTGALAVKEALARGHTVSAFARSPDKHGFDHPQLTKVVGDFHKPETLMSAVKGHDAVIVTASVPSLKTFKDKPDYFSDGTKHVIAAMKAAGVRRLVILSALGTRDSRRIVPFLTQKLIMDWFLKAPFADHVRQEVLTEASGLDWVIALPGRLTNGPAKKAYVKTAKIEKIPMAISRADVADFLVEAATSDAWVRKAVLIGG